MISYRQNVVKFPAFPTTEQSHKIAQDHYVWAKTAGQSDSQIMISIGLHPQHTENRGQVIDALRRTWLAIQCGWKREE